MSDVIALAVGDAHRQLDRQQTEQGGELDDGVHGHRRGVLERVAHRVADDRRRVQLGALLLHVGFHDLLGVVPGAAGVGHEDGLIQTEHGDGDQVADEEERLEEGEGQRTEEHGQEDVDHALLRVLRADADHLLAVFDVGAALFGIELDVFLDELDRPIGAGGHGLRGRTGEPVDHGAAHDEPSRNGG